MTQRIPEKSSSTFSLSELTEESFTAIGRRAFLQFRDLNVGTATSGRFGAVVIRMKESMKEQTGWHYHICDIQLLYVMKGWAELELETGEKVILKAGSCASIPPGMRHNETRTSDDLEVIEFTSPAKLETVPVESPIRTA